MKYIITLLTTVLFTASGVDAKPVKVFILAGQSNMQGAGLVDVPQQTIDNWKTRKNLTDGQVAAKLSGSLTYLAKNPDKKQMVKDLPFVIANSGFGGTAKGGGVVGRLQALVQPAQKAAEVLPRVTCVDTRPFYRAPELSPGGGDIEHWFSNAESYFLNGDASGKAMLQLLSKKQVE